MMKWLVLAFIGIPALEFYLLIQMGLSIGAFETFLLIIATGIVGAALARQQGMAVLQQIQDTMAAGQLPTLSLIEGACVLLCGALLVTPGMVTDVFGVLVMLPFGRRPLARWILNQVQAKMVTTNQSPFGASRVVIDMEPNPHARPTHETKASLE